MRPYYEADGIVLYHGDCRDLKLPLVDMTLADPPYGETSLAWDKWPDGWTDNLTSNSLWCFGSMRTFLRHRDELVGWRFAQDVVWEKQNGSGFAADRFKRVHEIAAHFYRGSWSDLYKAVVTTPDAIKRQIRRKRRPPHMGSIERGQYTSEDGGPRMMRSVVYCRNCHGYAEHPTQKPIDLLRPLIEYSCPPGGTVYVPFAGVGSELEAARSLGRRAIGVEIREEACELAARSLASRLPLSDC